MALITTFIPTFRRPALLKRAIDSILKQTYPHFQIYVCDNASGDETAEVVAQYAQKDGRIHYFCHKENIGMMGNYQFGLSLVKTPYFSFLSDDDLLLPNFYELTLQEFHKHPDLGFAAASTIIAKPCGTIVRVPFHGWSREGKFDPAEGFLEMIGKYPVPTAVLFSKKVLNHASIDTENILLWDPDYLLQIAALFPISISKKPGAIFLTHASSFSGGQDLATQEKAIHRLIQRIQDNKNLPSKIIETAVGLKRYDLFLCQRAFLLQSLKAKKMKEAKWIAKSLPPCYSWIVRAVEIFPWTIHLVCLVSHTRHGIYKFRIRRYKNYIISK